MTNKDIKIATKREALFIEVKEAAEKRIEGLEKQLEVEKEIVKMSEAIIAMEQDPETLTVKTK